MEDKYINPFTDFGFKKLFGEEPNKDLLINFLNTLLPERHKISDLSYTKNEQMGAASLDRKAVYDLYCISSTGERFIVEVQKAKQNFFKDRSLYYASFPIQEQALRGDWNYKLTPVYTVGILDFLFNEDEGDKTVVHTVQLKDQFGETFYDKLTFIYLSMPNFTKKEYELITLQDKWLYVFKCLPTLQKRPPALQEKVFDKLFTVAEVARFSSDQRDAYHQSVKYYRDLKNVEDTAWTTGMNRGLEQGMNRGLEQGLEQGLEMKEVEFVLKLHRKGNSHEHIADLMDLSVERVQAIIDAGAYYK